MSLQRNVHDSMDKKLWSRLPEDLMQRVLVFLPIPDVLRLRCVCKTWNSLLSSRRSLVDCPSICTSDSQIHLSQQPYLLCLTTVTSHPIIHVYNVSLCKWDLISLSFLPELEEISIIKSGGGLLYLKARVGYRDDTFFLTCNPLTKTWKQLPSVFLENEHYRLGMSSLTSMVCSSEPGRGYRIIEAGLNGLTDLRTKIYDSATGVWTTSGGLPSQVTGFESEGVIVNNCLYGVTCLPYKIIKMELDGSSTGGCWSEFSTSLPNFAVYPHLVESLGAMVMVGGYDPCWEEGFIPEPTALKVWRLDRSKMEWENLSTLPQDMRQRYLTQNCFDSLKCAAQGSTIYISNLDGSVVLVYNLVQNSWTRLLECPSLSNRQSCIEHMFIFNPSLQISL